MARQFTEYEALAATEQVEAVLDNLWSAMAICFNQKLYLAEGYDTFEEWVDQTVGIPLTDPHIKAITEGRAPWE